MCVEVSSRGATPVWLLFVLNEVERASCSCRGRDPSFGAKDMLLAMVSGLEPSRCNGAEMEGRGEAGHGNDRQPIFSPLGPLASGV